MLYSFGQHVVKHNNALYHIRTLFTEIQTRNSLIHLRAIAPTNVHLQFIRLIISLEDTNINSCKIMGVTEK